jgi:DNA-binding transcriptional MerR regulator
MSAAKNTTSQTDLFGTQDQTQTQAQPKAAPTQKIPGRRPMKKAAKPAAPQKAPGAFRTISEVAGELKVEQHVLRFWETKFSHIKPVKRGGGRRYYRPEDIELLKSIYHLLYNEGYTIKGVQKLLSKTRGHLSALTAEDAAEAPVSKAVSKNRTELQDMLAELKSMREMME